MFRFFKIDPYDIIDTLDLACELGGGRQLPIQGLIGEERNSVPSGAMVMEIDNGAAARQIPEKILSN